MKSKITISIDREVISFIDKQRKDIKTSPFINGLLNEWMEFTKNNNDGVEVKGGLN